MSEPTDEIDETMFPKRMRFFRRDRKMTMGDHLLYAPEDWRMYIREDTVKTAALEAEIARLQEIVAHYMRMFPTGEAALEALIEIEDQPETAHIAGLREAAKIVQERRDGRYKVAHEWVALDEAADAILARAAELETPHADL